MSAFDLESYELGIRDVMQTLSVVCSKIDHDSMSHEDRLLAIRFKLHIRRLKQDFEHLLVLMYADRVAAGIPVIRQFSVNRESDFFASSANWLYLYRFAAPGQWRYREGHSLSLQHFHDIRFALARSLIKRMARRFYGDEKQFICKKCCASADSLSDS